MEKTASPYDTLDIESIEVCSFYVVMQSTLNHRQVEPEYDGPQWEGEITEEFVVQMIEMFKNDKSVCDLPCCSLTDGLSGGFIASMHTRSYEQLKKMNNVVELEIPE
eukprot:764804-Hanusia_phi.AAC.1